MAGRFDGISRRLAQDRERAGLTVAQAASAYGVSPSTVRRWEKSDRTVARSSLALRALWRAGRMYGRTVGYYVG